MRKFTFIVLALLLVGCNVKHPAQQGIEEAFAVEQSRTKDK